ncbi:acyl-CoA dehydrogenase [Gordonia sp. HNM0687]|uniref:Acyl-CoA dehydrogenase n=1 Tax=Gordonia mangrovi TaxID=2665643 RepID=A0A6L7GTW3_9ACTN|nr:acyl-CoA dehydrogenase family protein [Gordonia mangrovi]MXP23376.1 acyl-CoA dehydrogenase [Gordonia mangrovi]UVF76720.1 acyl-CoA/acyl-ACP dehydrogenase [Gordonia mangrovi]
MDFALDDTAVAVRDAAAEVFARHEPDWETMFGRRDSEAVVPGGFDDALWRSVVDAGLTALPLPADLGGDDVSVIDLLPLLRRMGESAAVTPAVGSLVSAFAIHGADPSVRERWGQTLTDDAWHAVAVGELGDALTETPRTTVRDGRLTGTKTGVLHAEGSSALLVTTDDGAVLVASDADGVSKTRTPTSSGWGEFTVRFDGVAVSATDVVAADAHTVRDRYRLALATYAQGLVAGAARLTADHVTHREQFGKPIAMFQAVGQQLADVYVVARSLDLSTTAAAWRMSEGLDATQDLGIAAYWVAAEIPATLRIMTHLHGGIGVDVTYPLHRYFSIAKDLARLVGGPDARLDEIADDSDARLDPKGQAADVH